MALIVLGAIVLDAMSKGTAFVSRLIVIFSLITIAIIAFGGELGIRVGLFLVLTLALGYRTIQLRRNCPFIRPRFSCGSSWSAFSFNVSCFRFPPDVPVWLWMFMPFCVLPGGVDRRHRALGSDA